MQPDITAPPADTNLEYLAVEERAKHPSVLATVFRAIIVETVRDFFTGIFNFFRRYARHFRVSALVLWNPSLRRPPMDRLDYKDHSQHSFELTLLVLVAVLFMVKAGWIPRTTSVMLETYNDDLMQMGVEFAMFLVFAVSYLVQTLASVLYGRLVRVLFRPKVDRRESDMLQVYLNNALFTLTAVIALWARCSTSKAVGDTENITTVLLSVFFLSFFPCSLIWSLRYVRLNGMRGLRAFMYTAVTVFLYTIFFGFAGVMVTSFLLGV